MIISEKRKIKTYYKALVERDKNFVGIFYVGVKTTSIFCIATCRARKPLLKNVEFYPTFKEALEKGYRPCKICKPTENANQAPEQVEHAINLVKSNPNEKLSDNQLREKKISPDLVRRWFKENYGMTFHAFQRMYRINNAVLELKNGKKTTETAFENGYESLSGFGYTFKKLIGRSPQKSDDKNIILISRLTTPIGPMFVCATDKGICLLEFTNRIRLEKEFKDLQKLLNAEILAGENKFIVQAKKEVKEYFEGKRKTFEVALHTPGTDFQNSVWNTLTKIPYGQTVSYQEQAIQLQNPKAVRAVASTNGKNRIAIIIPCHRVIGSNGKLTGYAGGIERKKWLIEFEKKNID